MWLLSTRDECTYFPLDFDTRPFFTFLSFPVLKHIYFYYKTYFLTFSFCSHSQILCSPQIPHFPLTKSHVTSLSSGVFTRMVPERLFSHFHTIHSFLESWWSLMLFFLWMFFLSPQPEWTGADVVLHAPSGTWVLPWIWCPPAEKSRWRSSRTLFSHLQSGDSNTSLEGVRWVWNVMS